MACAKPGRDCMIITAVSYGSTFSLLLLMMWLMMLVHFSSPDFKDKMQCRGDALLKGWHQSCQGRGHNITVDEEDELKPQKSGGRHAIKPPMKLNELLPVVVQPPTEGKPAWLKLVLKVDRKTTEPIVFSFDLIDNMKPVACKTVQGPERVFLKGNLVKKNINIVPGTIERVGCLNTHKGDAEDFNVRFVSKGPLVKGSLEINIMVENPPGDGEVPFDCIGWSASGAYTDTSLAVHLPKSAHATPVPAPVYNAPPPAPPEDVDDGKGGVSGYAFLIGGNMRRSFSLK